MQAACVIYDEYTMLDIIGPFQMLNAAGFDTIWVSPDGEPVQDHTRTASLAAQASIDEITSPDIVVMPGGMNTNKHFDGPLIPWLQAVHPTTTWTTSVCTGSHLLAKAGLLDGLTATGHWASLDVLKQFGATPTTDRVVFHRDERIVTAAGVSSGIDMGLALIAEMHGTEVAEMCQLALEYDPQPITDKGSPEKAGPEMVASMRGFFSSNF